MQQPRLLRVFFGVVLVQAIVVVILSIIGLVNAEQIAEDANERETTTSTTTTTEPGATSTTAGPSPDEGDDDDDDKAETTPSGVRFTSGLFLAAMVVEVGLLFLLFRRDSRARVPLMIMLGLSAVFPPLGIITLLVALFGIYTLQFDKTVRAWLAGAGAETDGDDEFEDEPE